MASANAKYLVWSGEEQAYTQDVVNEKGETETIPAPGPSFINWNGLRFNKDKPTLVDPAEAPGNLKDAWEHMLKKAPKMKTSFKVLDVGEDGEPVDPDDYEEVEVEEEHHEPMQHHTSDHERHHTAPAKVKKKVRKRK